MLIPAVAFDNPQNYNHQAKRYAESLDNAVWTNQFDNTANLKAHLKTTGPEIWDQTNGGQLDGFICATGTGGTLAGVTRYLKERSDNKIKAYLADPPGSVLYRLIEHGKAEREGNGSITEGESGFIVASGFGGLQGIVKRKVEKGRSDIRREYENIRSTMADMRTREDCKFANRLNED